VVGYLRIGARDIHGLAMIEKGIRSRV